MKKVLGGVLIWLISLSSFASDFSYFPVFNNDGTIYSLEVLVTSTDTNIPTMSIILTQEDTDLSLNPNGDLQNKGQIKSAVKTKYQSQYQDYLTEKQLRDTRDNDWKIKKNKIDLHISTSDL